IVALALGFIGFNIGHELDFNTIKKLDPKISLILICESVGTLLIVGFLVFIVTQSIQLAIIFGALASATAPAATADVVWEYKASGPLTTTILAILVLDDILAIILIDISLGISLALYDSGSIDLLMVLANSLWHSSASAILGAAAGGIIAMIVVKGVKDPIDAMELVFGTLIIIIGIASIFNLSVILACTLYGMTAESLIKVDTRELIHQIFRIGAPVIAIFFIMVGIQGMKAEVGNLVTVALIGTVYLIARSAGKVGGAWIGSRAAKSPDCVQKYLGVCLLSQAGVPIALAVLVAEKFKEVGGEAADAGVLILETVTITTLIVQLLAPLLVKWALEKAGETQTKIPSRILPVSEGKAISALEVLEAECEDDITPSKPPPEELIRNGSA
ncbi:MAG: cation:proton antiporter, partial [Candidatus Hodarchaeota archaeon]